MITDDEDIVELTIPGNPVRPREEVFPRIPTAVPGPRKSQSMRTAGAAASAVKLASIGKARRIAFEEPAAPRQVVFDDSTMSGDPMEPPGSPTMSHPDRHTPAQAGSPQPGRKSQSVSPVMLRRSQSEPSYRPPSRLFRQPRKPKYRAKYELSTVMLLAEYFKCMDEDQDGRVFYDEFKKYYELRAKVSEIHGLPDNWSEAEGFFELLDAQHLGFITFLDVIRANFPLANKRDITAMMHAAFPERMRAATAHSHPQLSDEQRQEIVDMFTTIDTDDSGTITVAELRSYLSKLGFYTKEEVRLLISSMDADGDGLVSLMEFIAAMQSSYLAVSGHR